MVAGHWDCPSLRINSRYMLFSLASINFGKSKCELRGLSQLRFSILFFYWVAGTASIRRNLNYLFSLSGNTVLLRYGDLCWIVLAVEQSQTVFLSLRFPLNEYT